MLELERSGNGTGGRNPGNGGAREGGGAVDPVAGVRQAEGVVRGNGRVPEAGEKGGEELRCGGGGGGGRPVDNVLDPLRERSRMDGMPPDRIVEIRRSRGGLLGKLRKPRKSLTTLGKTKRHRCLF